MNKRMWAASCALVVGCGGASGDSTGETVGSTGVTAGTGGTDDTGGTVPTSGTTTGVPTTGVTENGSNSASQTTDTPSTGAVSVTEASAGTTGVGETTQDGTLTDGTGTMADTDGTGGTTDDPPPQKQCSADFHAVVDEQGNVLETCAPEQGCADGACIAACDAAAASKANFGCGFLVPTPPAYPPALPPCFAVFLANTWGHPAKIAVARGGVSLDIGVAARLVTPGLAPKDWPALPAEGVPADAVAVVFLSSDPNSIMPENQVPLSCPFTPAVDKSTVIPGSGRSDAFAISADIPLTAYDILPFGGARSHFPSAELLFPTSVWGTNYVAMSPPAGTASPPGPMWLQIVGLEDGTKVELKPTADLLQGPNLNGAIAGQLAAYEIDAGEVIQWELPQGPKDSAGTLLLSDKPVALHAGNRFLRLQPIDAPGGEAAHQHGRVRWCNHRCRGF